MDKKKIILIDFDYTLFDTDKFVKYLQRAPEIINFKDFLYPDALEFINYASKIDEITLFSEGDENFQKAKIVGTGIGKLFPGGVKILPSFTKVQELLKISRNGNVVLIDDKPEVVDSALSMGCKVIRVKRGKYEKDDTKTKPNQTVGTLSEIINKDLLRSI